MSLRIRKLAELVRPGLIPADIGTDHGLLPILLLEQGKAEKAYACDVAEGPLSQARENIAKHHLEGKVIPIRSNGFDEVPPDADAAIIAGMGCHTAIMIMEKAEERISRLSQLILQVNDEVPLLRRWLADHSFVIARELTIEDRGHFYTVLDTCYGETGHVTERDLLFGRLSAIVDRKMWLRWTNAESKRLNFVIERRGGSAELEHEKNLLLQAVREMNEMNE